MKKKRTSRGKAAGEPAAPVAETDSASSHPTGLLSSLGLHGLAHLDAPVLAALASEAPMLLVGPHGSAKSALLERLAAALRLEHRHYNASLISFDDLVGFPVPDGDGLRYLNTPATLWSGARRASSSTRSAAAGPRCRTSSSRSSTRSAFRGSRWSSCGTAGRR